MSGAATSASSQRRASDPTASGTVDTPKSPSFRVAIAVPSHDYANRWREALAPLLPQASVECWQPGQAPADYAAGWHPPEGFFAAQPSLRAFFSLGAGVDNVMGLPELPAHLPVVRVEDGGMGEQMVEYALLEALRLQRHDREYSEQQRARRWHQLEPMSRPELSVGVFGLGVLGRQVARALADFGYTVHGYSRSAQQLAGITCHHEDAREEGLRAFLAASRLVIVLAPLTNATRGFFNASRLRAMAQGATLVNLARGALVDEDALLTVLDEGHLAGATLDVFATEPLPPDHRLWTHPRVRITPHVSAVTPLTTAARQIAAKIGAHAEGQAISGMVERNRGY